ncbi:MAG TPA: hypothetical protein VGM39_24290 [Kofleriaceae bacterium]|jgi:hypothetical protein
MKLLGIACLALAASSLAACTSLDDMPSDGNATISLGDGPIARQSVFGAAGSYIQVFIAEHADADAFTIAGDPRITFMLDVGDTHAPDTIPSVVLDDDMDGPRLNVLEGGTVSRFATSGTITVESCRWDEDGPRLLEVLGEIDATLEGGGHLTGTFSSVRERHSGV